MQLLHSIGLLALIGLLVPVIIHLWNIKQGKTLKIGSIALLGENSSKSSRSLKLTDLLLFFLRCLLLILIALILAQAYIKKTVVAQQVGWILVDQSIAREVYQSNKKSIDSLVNLGFEVHDFNIGFDKFNLEDTTTHPQVLPKLSYTSLINKLNDSLSTGHSVYVFADRSLNNFDGDLANLKFRLNWKQIAATDTLSTWNTTFLNQSYEGKSSPSLTTYAQKGVGNLNAAVLSAVIYSPSTIDAGYLTAGLKAISDFTKEKITIKPLNKETIAAADLVFWLSDQPMPSHYSEQVKRGATVFSYQPGKIMAVQALLKLNSEWSATQQPMLQKRTAFDGTNTEVIWEDGFGAPVLTREMKQDRIHFYFYSRFNPQFGELIWTEQFVNALLPIVFGNKKAIDFGFENHPDDRRVYQGNLNTGFAAMSSKLKATTTINQSIVPWLWLFAFLTLFTERILSFRKKSLANVKN